VNHLTILLPHKGKAPKAKNSQSNLSIRTHYSMNFKSTKMYFPLKLVIHEAPNVDVDQLLYNLFVGLLQKK